MNSKKAQKKKLFVFFVLIVLAGCFATYKYMYKDHRDIASEKAAYVLDIQAIKKEFSQDADGATKKYLDKVIEIKGEVSESDSESFTLDSFVLCYTDSTVITSIKQKDVLIVKGRFIGFDELLETIKMDQVTLEK